MTAPIGELAYIIIDCNDNQKVAEFWSSLLGLAIHKVNPPYIDLEAAPGIPRLSFQAIAEKKCGKNRLHLDIKVSDLDVAKSKAELLGARLVEDHHYKKWRWLTMADPEDNEFCLIND